MRHTPTGIKAQHGGPSPPPPPSLLVHNTAEFLTALGVVVGGQTIRCAAGNYAGIGTISGKSFSPAIIITSNDLANRAVFNYFEMASCAGFTFKSVDFVVLLPAFYGWKFDTCSRIILQDVRCSSNSADPTQYSSTGGIRFFTCDHVTVEDGDIFHLAAGLAFATGTAAFSVLRNKIHDVSSDGIDLGVCSNGRIGENYIHDFKPQTGDHPDAVQFQQSTSNIEVSNNLIWRGAGENTQGIFLGDGTHTNPNVSGNLVVGTGASGIRPINCINLIANDNELVTYVGGDTTNFLVQLSDTVLVTNTKTLAGGFAIVTSTNVTESGTSTIAAANDEGATAIAAWRLLNPTVPT